MTFLEPGVTVTQPVLNALHELEQFDMITYLEID